MSPFVDNQQAVRGMIMDISDATEPQGSNNEEEGDEQN